VIPSEKESLHLMLRKRFRRVVITVLNYLEKVLLQNLHTLLTEMFILVYKLNETARS